MPTTEENKRLVLNAFRPFEEGDSGPLFELIADDVKWTIMGRTPLSGVYYSKQDVMDKVIRPVMVRLEDGLKTKLVDLACEGDKVFLRFDSNGVAKSGMAYDQSLCWAIVMRDGRIAEIVDYFDTDLFSKLIA